MMAFSGKMVLDSASVGSFLCQIWAVNKGRSFHLSLSPDMGFKDAADLRGYGGDV